MMHHLRLLVLVFMTGFATQAAALDPCGQVVVDTAAVLGDLASVEAAAAALATATGAEVRVRLAPDHSPEANLDVHVERVSNDVCPAWINAAGNRRSNMIILWVTMNRQIGLYYGSQWNAALGPTWPTINEAMKPALRGGEYDTAMVLGLERIAETITAASAPAARTTERIVEREPVNLVPFAVVLLVAVLLFGLYRIWNVSQAYQREQGKRFTAQQRAIEAFRSIALHLVAVQKAEHAATEKLKATKDLVSRKQLQAWSKQVNEHARAEAALSARYNAFANPDRPNLTREEYESSQESLEAFDEEVKALLGVFEKVLSEVEEVEVAAAGVPEELVQVEALLPAAMATIRAIEEQGFTVTEATALLEDGQTDIKAAKDGIADRDWSAAKALLDSVRQSVGKAVTVAEALPQRRRALQEDLQSLRGSMNAFAEQKQKARKVFDVMATAYTKDGYSLVAGNGSEAERLYKALDGECLAVEQMIKTQDWDPAEKRLLQAVESWKTIAGLLEAIEHRQKHLGDLVRDADAEYTEAKRSLEVLTARLNDYPQYVTKDRKDALKRLADDLTRAATLAAQVPLPVVERFRLVTEIDAAADAMLAEVDASLAEATARTERAQRAKRDVEARVRDYRHYVKNHRQDVGGDVMAALTTIEQRLAALEGEGDAATILALCVTLNEALDAVGQSAKSAVRSAESSRAEARRARESRPTSSGKTKSRRDLDDGGSFSSGQVSPSFDTGSRSRDTWGGGSSTYDPSPSNNGGGGSSTFDSSPSDSGGGGSSSW